MYDDPRAELRNEMAREGRGPHELRFASNSRYSFSVASSATYPREEEK